MSELREAARFYDLSEAVVARSYLDERGIYAVVPDYNFASTSRHLITEIQAVRILVRDEDFDEARALLSDIGRSSSAKCPACGSERIAAPKRLRWALISIFTAFVWQAAPSSIPATAERRCRACGERWLVESDGEQPPGSLGRPDMPV